MLQQYDNETAGHQGENHDAAKFSKHYNHFTFINRIKNKRKQHQESQVIELQTTE